MLVNTKTSPSCTLSLELVDPETLRAEVKYLADNFTASFEIVLGILTKRDKMTVKE